MGRRRFGNGIKFNQVVIGLFVVLTVLVLINVALGGPSINQIIDTTFGRRGAHLEDDELHTHGDYADQRFDGGADKGKLSAKGNGYFIFEKGGDSVTLVNQKGDYIYWPETQKPSEELLNSLAQFFGTKREQIKVEPVATVEEGGSINQNQVKYNDALVAPQDGVGSGLTKEQLQKSREYVPQR